MLNFKEKQNTTNISNIWLWDKFSSNKLHKNTKIVLSEGESKQKPKLSLKNFHLLYAAALFSPCFWVDRIFNSDTIGAQINAHRWSGHGKLTGLAPGSKVQKRAIWNQDRASAIALLDPGT